ncbi:MAG: hypothetical protein QM485_10285 [Flavobacteriaceae bacterium]
MAVTWTNFAATYAIDVSLTGRQNRQVMFAQIKAPNYYSKCLIGWRGASDSNPTNTITFTPTSSTFTASVRIWIGNNRNISGGDIGITLYRTRQTVTPTPGNPIINGNTVISCDSVDTDGDGIHD